MNLPLAIVKARINNWEKMWNASSYSSPMRKMASNRILYYKKLHRKIELEQYFNVRL